jgi:uncharacterized glyoxalase superfamily protein PhnB
MTVSSATVQTLFPAFRYADARAALEFFQRAFGAEAHTVYDNPDGSIGHAEVAIAGNLFMFGTARDDEYPVQSARQVDGVTAGMYVALSDAAAVDALHARAVAAGATIHRAPYDTDYGSHECRLLDIDGNPWTFGTYRPEIRS